jgi:hypothetical protein
MKTKPVKMWTIRDTTFPFGSRPIREQHSSRWIIAPMEAHGVVLAVLLSVSAAYAQVPKQMPVMAIAKPTVIAFFQQATKADADKDEGENEALSDFNFYAAKAEQRLRKVGIDFRLIDQSSFRVRIGNRVRTFRSGPIEVGYYLIAPGKEPHIEFGVKTDEDLSEVAAKYFGLTISEYGSPCPAPLRTPTASDNSSDRD